MFQATITLIAIFGSYKNWQTVQFGLSSIDYEFARTVTISAM